MENMSVAKLRAILETLPDDMPVTLLVDDGCGCCSSGGDYEPALLEVVNGEARIIW